MHDIERTDTSDTTMADAFARAGFDTTTVIETDDGDDDGPRAQSQTAIACEQAALFGATPERDEFDNLRALLHCPGSLKIVLVA